MERGMERKRWIEGGRGEGEERGERRGSEREW